MKNSALSRAATDPPFTIGTSYRISRADFPFTSVLNCNWSQSWYIPDWYCSSCYCAVGTGSGKEISRFSSRDAVLVNW